MKAPPPSIDEIRDQMQIARGRIAGDAERLVRRARVLTDWRHYVRLCPWLCMGAAAAAGFSLTSLISARIARRSAPPAEPSRNGSSSAPVEATALARPGTGATLARVAAEVVAKALVAAVRQEIGQALARRAARPAEQTEPTQARGDLCDESRTGAEWSRSYSS
jgi:hypothetical protein